MGLHDKWWFRVVFLWWYRVVSFIGFGWLPRIGVQLFVLSDQTINIWKNSMSDWHEERQYYGISLNHIHTGKLCFHFELAHWITDLPLRLQLVALDYSRDWVFLKFVFGCLRWNVNWKMYSRVDWGLFEAIGLGRAWTFQSKPCDFRDWEFLFVQRMITI